MEAWGSRPNSGVRPIGGRPDSAASEERFCFLAEWYDPQAALIRRYNFMFYPRDNTIEMFDLKNRRPFLRRSKADNINISDIYIGSTINVLNRQLHFVSYGDDYTKNRLASKKERTLGMIKPDAIGKLGQIIELIQRGDCHITKLKMCRLGRNEASQFYQEHQSKPFFNDLISFITSGPVVAFELMGEGAISAWRQMLGPTDSSMARREAASSIRARFGTDGQRNACHGSDSPESAAREIEFFFPSGGQVRQNTATFKDCTCCVIKPHAVINRQAGAIIQKILESGWFEITALQMFHMEQANAEEFFEVYKGVVQEYQSMVNQLTCGPCIALEVRDTRGHSTPESFREFTGPADPEIARHLRPTTIRASFGKNKIENAVHCTDLPEDGLLEVEYFFKILDH